MRRHFFLLALFCAAASAAPLKITTTSLPGGRVGTAYSATVTASGGSKPYSWSISGGALPDGFTLDPASGTISGMPTAAGTTSFTVGVRDKDNNTDTQALSIRVDPAPLTVTTSSLPPGTVGSPYSASLTATGGTDGYTWSIPAGSLPAGLTLSGSTISGTPTSAGMSNFTVQVTDSSNATASKPLSIAIAAPATPALAITTSSLPPATVGTPYSATLSSTGGAGGNIWSIASGTLPAGLTLNGSAISGTPTTAGTSSFTVQVKDSANNTATKPLSITVAPPALTITTTLLPAGAVGAPYAATLAATGGSGGNTWSIVSGSLPAGLSLSGATIAGTPTAPGASTFTVQVKDASNTTATQPLTITVAAPALTITTNSLPSATVLTAYSTTLTAAGGTVGYSWSITSGSLPLGLTLGAGGTISGAPVLPGTSNFTVQVRDSSNSTASKPLTLTVTATQIVITTQSLAPAEQGAPYSQALAASGGTGQYRWSISDGALPAGLALDPAGRIAGTPTGTGSSFTLQVTDTAGATASKTFTLDVAGAPTFSSPAALPSGALGASYSTFLAVSGGQSPYTFTLATGALPPGLTLNATNGEIAGKPSQAGNFTFTVQARDAAGAVTRSDVTITIAAGLTITTAPVLPAASLALAYQASLAASGGAPPYTWSATAGSLPAGVTLHSDGKLDGTPTAAGAFSFTATVTDANGASASKDFTLTVAAGLTITTAPQLPPAVPGAAYSATLAAAGGRAPYTWGVSAGSLPAGLTLNSGTGVLSGTTNALGTFNFTATVTDGANLTAQKAFTLTVAPGLTLTGPAALPNAVAGAPYSFTLTASGGQQPYSWRVSNGALPDGLALNSATGVISGTPTAGGTFNFTVEVADAANLKGSRVETIVAALPAQPTLLLSGIPATLAPLQQPAVTLGLSAPYPVAITGRLNLTFTPAAGMPDDPSIQFSSGGHSVAFTIPANATRATFPQPQLAVQTGSVAGALQFTAESLQAGGSALPSPGGPLASAQLSPAAASIRSVTVRRSAAGFDVQVVGVSNTRELTTASVRFHPSAGTTVSTTEVSIPLATAAKAWFGVSSSNAYGGQFTLTLPFSITNGTVSLDSVSVVLTNSAGASAETSAPY
jgi:large repetitive protein